MGTLLACSLAPVCIPTEPRTDGIPGVFVITQPGVGTQTHQQGALSLCFDLHAPGWELGKFQQVLLWEGVSGSPEKAPRPQRSKIADCVYLKLVTISHRLTSSGCVCGWKCLSG